jgi:hypothetical protein
MIVSPRETKMNRIEYGVRLGWTVNVDGRTVPYYGGFYEGRDQHGQIKIGKSPSAAAMMTEEVAQALVAKLKEKYPLSEVTELICNERDELTATSLAELGEAPAPQPDPETTLAQMIIELDRQFARECEQADVGGRRKELHVPHHRHSGSHVKVLTQLSANWARAPFPAFFF